MRLKTDHHGISFFFFFVNRLKLLSWTGMNFSSLFHFWLLVTFLLYIFGLNDFLKTNLYDFASYKEHSLCVFKPGLPYNASISISTSISTRIFTRVISISIRWHTQAQKHKKLLPPFCKRQSMSNQNVRWQLATVFSVYFSCACAYACVVPVYTCDATTQAQAQENGNHSILLCSCLCRCVVRVNRDDASMSTRRLCLRRTGLHVGFLCLCLRRTCKPGIW